MKVNTLMVDNNHIKLLIFPFFFMLPLVQMGVSYYFSIQTLLLIYLLYCLSLNTFIRLSYWYFLVFMLMVAPSFLYAVNNQSDLILWALRFFFCVAVLLAAISYKSKIEIDALMFEKPVVIFLSSLIMVTLLQFIGLKEGHPMQLPSDIFVGNKGTMAGFETALSFG